MARSQGYYPLFLRIEGARVVVVGGGAVALRKCRPLLAAGARVEVFAPEMCAAVKRLRGAVLHEAAFCASHLRGARLVVAASDSPAVNARVAAAARRRNIPVNVVDDAALSTFIVPAALTRGPVTIAVSTGGASPALARNLRDRIAEAISPHVGRHAAFLARTRQQVKAKVADPARRRAILERLAGPEVAALIAEGRPAAARGLVREMIARAHES